MNLGMHYQHFTTHSMRYHDVLINPVLYKSIILIFEKNHLHLPNYYCWYIYYITIQDLKSIFFSFRLQVQDKQFKNVCLLKISWLKDK